MQFIPKHFFRGVVPETLTKISEEVKLDETFIIKNIFINNKNETTESLLDLYVVKNGEFVDETKSIFNNLKYDAGQKENINDLFIVLEAGDSLYAKQTTINALNIYISGIRQTK